MVVSVVWSVQLWYASVQFWYAYIDCRLLLVSSTAVSGVVLVNEAVGSEVVQWWYDGSE